MVILYIIEVSKGDEKAMMRFFQKKASAGMVF